MATAPVTHSRDLTRVELDPLQCGSPGCTCAGPLMLTPTCHIGQPLFVSYDWTTGRLTAMCSVCERFVASIFVAQTRPGGPTRPAA